VLGIWIVLDTFQVLMKFVVWKKTDFLFVEIGSEQSYLDRIWCSHSGGYEEFYLMEYNAIESQ
jgi:hypothetical protein